MDLDYLAKYENASFHESAIIACQSSLQSSQLASHTHGAV